jgi:soluble lytic murein transglycosylase
MLADDAVTIFSTQKVPAIRGYFARRTVFGGIGILLFAGSTLASPMPPPRPESMGWQGIKVTAVDPSLISGPKQSGYGRNATKSVGVYAPLSTKDAKLYRQIFAYQAQGKWAKADQLVRGLNSNLLLGHVRYQRLMHPTDYKASFPELSRWMAKYAGHPNAFKVYSLARKRQPSGVRAPKEPVFGKEYLRHFLGDGTKAAPTAIQRNRVLEAPLRALISKGKLVEAEQAIASSALNTGASDRLRSKIAFVRLMRGQQTAALKLASSVAKRSRGQTSLPDWVAGLAAYQLGKYAKASSHFALYAQSRHADEWNSAAGAFWAGRAEQKLNNHKNADSWWRIAAEHRYTFYGQLARAKVGLSGTDNWSGNTPSNRDVANLRSLDGGLRSLALAQVGEVRRADEELLQLLGNAGPKRTQMVTRLAQHLRLPQTSVRGAFRLAGYSIAPPPAALYPMPPWAPKGKQLVDQALIWAFVRQESLFNPRATSSAGARGLMQLMPATANYVAGKDTFRGKQRDGLYEPPTNLSLGQRYLQYLMGKSFVQNDLFRLAVAYNAGVGNLTKWRKRGALSSDPLMFIETLPVLETRLFIEGVLANFWLYRQQLGQPTPSLTDLVHNTWPRYIHMDGRGVEIAREPQDGN